MTQYDVAMNSGIQRSYYTMIESGSRTPSVNTAKLISKTLGFDWIIFFEDKCNKSKHRSKEVI